MYSSALGNNLESSGLKLKDNEKSGRSKLVDGGLAMVN